MNAKPFAIVSAWAIGLFVFTTITIASPSQDEVFNSIRTHVSESSSDATLIVLLFVGGVIALCGLVYLSHREVRAVSPSTLNHQGKLLKEIMRETGLKAAELKQLKMLAERLEERQNLKLKSPLTLMLCPSVLQRAMREQAPPV